MTLQLTMEIDADAFKKGIDDVRDRYDQALAVAKNMIVSMLRTEILADIRSAGNFGSFTDGLTVTVDGDAITTTLDAPGASIFETGGVIHGNPLLWLPISGTDAEGVQASDYGDKLFSVNRKNGGVPLLFSIKDHAPKYFGTPSVNIPQKFHIEDIENRIAAQFEDVLNHALGGANG